MINLFIFVGGGKNIWYIHMCVYSCTCLYTGVCDCESDRYVVS